MVQLKYSLLALAVLPALASGYTTVFETSFNTLPDSWYATKFKFAASGAYINTSGSMSYDANLYSGESGNSCIIFIPDGIDSVQVSIGQILNVSGGEFPNMEFKIWLGTDDHGWDLVWEEDINHQNTSCSHSGTFTFSPDWIKGGDFLGIYFRADVIPDEYGSSVYWLLYNMQVNVFGDILALEQNTWSAIKASFN